MWGPSGEQSPEAPAEPFPPKADPVLFNFRLKCKQASAPAAPAPNPIGALISLGRRAAFRGGRGRLAQGQESQQG